MGQFRVLIEGQKRLKVDRAAAEHDETWPFGNPSKNRRDYHVSGPLEDGKITRANVVFGRDIQPVMKVAGNLMDCDWHDMRVEIHRGEHPKGAIVYNRYDCDQIEGEDHRKWINENCAGRFVIIQDRRGLLLDQDSVFFEDEADQMMFAVRFASTIIRTA